MLPKSVLLKLASGIDPILIVPVVRVESSILRLSACFKDKDNPKFSDLAIDKSAAVLILAILSDESFRKVNRLFLKLLNFEISMFEFFCPERFDAAGDEEFHDAFFEAVLRHAQYLARSPRRHYSPLLVCPCRLHPAFQTSWPKTSNNLPNVC